MHQVDQCPHKDDIAVELVTENETESDQENCEEFNIVLMTKYYADIAKSEVFVTEAFKSTVIDTACTKTVTSQIQFESFKSNLTEQTLKEIETFLSNTSFKFGDGRKKIFKCCYFLVVIVNKHCKVNAECY